MTLDPNKMALLGQLLDAMNPERLTFEELQHFQEQILSHIENLQKRNEADMSAIMEAVKAFMSRTEAKHEKMAESMKSEMMAATEKSMNKMMLEHESMMSECDTKMQAMEEKMEEMDANHAEMEKGMEAKMKALIPKMPELKPDTPEELRRKIGTLELSAINGLEDRLNTISNRIPTRTLGASVVHKFMDDETPVGTVNGTNTVFTLAKPPLTGSLKVYVNGARMRVTEDYTLAGRTITFNTAPPTNSVLLCDYRYF